MISLRLSGSWRWPLLAGICLLASPALAQDVVAVLSSDSPAYREALAGFEEAYGHPVPTYILSKSDVHLPNSAKVFATFGGAAATYPYPARSTLIYSLAPSVELVGGTDAGVRVKVRISPPPDIMLSNLRNIQPHLNHLAVFWIDPPVGAIFHDMEPAAHTLGIELLAVHVAKAEDFPAALRALQGRMDAMWFIPDPMLVKPGIFAMAKEYSSSNGIPFYVPIDSLVDKGAVASVSCSFREMGSVSGKLASRAVAGTLGDVTRVYGQKVIVTLNLTAAAKAGLNIPSDVIKQAARVVP